MKTKTLTIPPEVVEILRQSKIEADRLTLPPGQLDRELYQQVEKIIKAAGGKWDRKARAHVFQTDPRIMFHAALMEGKIVDEKATRQAFYTPPAIAKLVVERAELSKIHTVLEPSAGEGALVREVLKREHKSVLAIEIDATAAAKMEKTFARNVHVQVRNLDFLSYRHQGTPFDRVVMNPPFTAGQEVDHVSAAFRLLRKGGRLVAVMSASAVSRQDGKYAQFRAGLESNCEDVRWEDLPEKAFAESGTDVRTVLLSANMRMR